METTISVSAANFGNYCGFSRLLHFCVKIHKFPMKKKQSNITCWI